MKSLFVRVFKTILNTGVLWMYRSGGILLVQLAVVGILDYNSPGIEFLEPLLKLWFLWY